MIHWIFLFFTVPSILGKTVENFESHSCKPQCPCIFNGVYFDDGDTWSPEDKPCIKYKCANGFYEAVEIGCSYEGKCKEANSTWTERCMTFQCVAFDDIRTAEYRLIEGGCESHDGNCLRVGEKENDDCREKQCQIVDGSCYKMINVSEGCLYGGECKKLDSYWHDGCSVFQCEKRSEMSPYFYLQTNERMYWPQGNYSLFETIGGCPSDIKEAWFKGSRLHWSNGQSFKSNPFHLSGNYTEKYYKHRFCTHKAFKEHELLPKYQTYWDSGRYCIMRYGGQCPPGFENGYIGMDDLNGMESFNLIDGVVPDGIYTPDTGFFFCCRRDGKIEKGITLPRDLPFALFMAKGENVCQIVKGMSVSKEYFAFDDENRHVKLQMNGSVPEVKDCDNNTMLYYCFYSPLDCGCEHSDGTIIPEGQTLEKNCISYHCKMSNDERYLDVLSGGCNIDDKCVSENKTWTITSGETCELKSCVASFNDKNEKVYKEVTIFRGCRDDNLECRHIGYIKNRGCFVLKCILSKANNEPYFSATKLGCTNGQGKCVAIGEQFTKDCITYKCKKHSTKCANEYIKGQCEYKGKCYDEGKTFNDSGCVERYCNVTNTGKSIIFSSSVKQARCSYKGKCYAIGEKVRDGCQDRECLANARGHACGMARTGGGCRTNTNDCKPVNATWKEGCNVRRCTSKRINDTIEFTNSIETLRCSYDNGTKCLEAGATEKIGCNYYVCLTKITKSASHATLKAVSRECPWKGKCHPVGEIIFDHCVNYTCTQEGNTLSIKHHSVGCPMGVSCRLNGEIWFNNTYCADQQCTSMTNSQGVGSYRIHTLNYGCNINGKCYQNNTDWIESCKKNTCKTIVKGTKIYSSPTVEGCKEDTTGKCRQRNEKWTASGNHAHFCMLYTCKTDQYNRDIPQTTGYVCKDKDGNCKQIGEKGFSIKFKSKTYPNCKCVDDGNGNGKPDCNSSG